MLSFPDFSCSDFPCVLLIFRKKNGQDVDNNLITSGKKGVFYQASVYLFIYLLVLSNFT